jgi:hypothetical protein
VDELDGEDGLLFLEGTRLFDADRNAIGQQSVSSSRNILL